VVGDGVGDGPGVLVNVAGGRVLGGDGIKVRVGEAVQVGVGIGVCEGVGDGAGVLVNVAGGRVRVGIGVFVGGAVKIGDGVLDGVTDG